MNTKACDNYQKKRAPKKVQLEKDFAGIRAGQWMFVGTPQIVAKYLEGIPQGETVSIPKLRNQIARRHRCDAMCPVSTAIFLRIVADWAVEEMDAGVPVDQVAPFWRAIGPDDRIAKKLAIDSTRLQALREAEQSSPSATDPTPC
ncbi:MAG: hypothetical protein AAF265_02555 [Pseudomonadota bacterium]